MGDAGQVEFSISDEFPMSDFEMSRILDRAVLVVRRALSAQIEGYDLARTKPRSDRRPAKWLAPRELEEAALNANGLANPNTAHADSGSPPDGPADINTWSWSGQLIEVDPSNRMREASWKLASYLWERLNRKVSVSDLIGAGELFENVEPGTVARHGSGANTWFRNHKVPLKTATRDGHIWMESEEK